MRKVKYAVIVDSNEEMFVILQDGGVASCYNNGEHLITEYYQDRLTKESFDEEESIWDELGEGKLYIKDWDGSDEDSPFKEEWDEEVIQDMLQWLYASTEAIEFERVELDWNDVQAKKDFITEED